MPYSGRKLKTRLLRKIQKVGMQFLRFKRRTRILLGTRLHVLQASEIEELCYPSPLEHRLFYHETKILA